MGQRGLDRGRGKYLPAGIRPHSDVAVCPACEAGVDARAVRGLALFAVEAAPVGDVEGHDDAVAPFEECHAWADFLDDAHIFVACGSAIGLVGSRWECVEGWRGGLIPNMRPLFAAVRPWYMCRSEPQIAVEWG